jgi:hypothetical protein
MDDIQKRVFHELFLAPSVVLPIVAGASAWLISWGLGGVEALNAAGLVGVLGGIGWMATRLIFQLDDITERTHRFALERARRDEESKIDQLAGQLTTEIDHRAVDYLILLRDSRREFEALAEGAAMQVQALKVLPQFRQLFWAAIEQLEQSDKLAKLSSQLRSSERRDILARRDEILDDIKAASQRLSTAVDQFRQMGLRDRNSDLDELREELDVSLKVAKRAEERMRELETDFSNQRPINE